MRERFWRQPAAAPATTPPTVTTLAHLAGATADDFSRTETRELFLAIGAALAGGATTPAEVIAALPPHLREYAAWIALAGAEDRGTVTPDQAPESVTALRLLNVRRELDGLQLALADRPSDPALIERVRELTAFMGAATKAFPRAESVSRAAFGRERDRLPARVPLDVLRFRREAQR